MTRDRELAVFAVFSSAAGVFGNPGQAGYAAANTFLDAFAARLRADGVPATSLAWGLWETGMGAGLSDGDRARIRAGGIRSLTEEQGLALFDLALAGPAALAVPIGVDLPALAAAAGAGMLPALLSGLVPAARSSAPVPTGPTLAARLTGLTVEEQDRLVLDTVRSLVAGVLGHDSGGAVPAGTAFSELGFDSLTAVELRNRLTAATGLRLPTTLVFDYPSAATLAAHLAAELRPAEVDAVVPVLAELNRLEASLITLDADEGGRATVTARLQALLATWQDADRTAGAATLVEELDTATDDEMFDLLGKQFGIS